MNTRPLLASALVAVIALSGCVTNSSPGFEAGPAPRMEEGVATTMTALYDSAPGARELAAKARGILVFPRVVDGGVIVGGEYGRGQLSVDGHNAGSYKVTSISLGLQVGLQSQSLVLMFMSQEALDRFTSKSNWTAGADASVVPALIGALILLLGRDTEALVWALRLISLLNPLLAYFLVKRISSPVAGLIAAALVSSLLAFNVGSIVAINIDGLMLTFFLLSLLTLIAAICRRRADFSSPSSPACSSGWPY